MYAIGFLELNSIAQGIEAADTILKTAGTELIFARESCPGKFYILFKGETAAVEESMQAGQQAAGCHCIDSTVIASVHPDVIKAINCVSEAEEYDAIGIVEFFNVAAAIKASDIAVKTARVSIANLRLGTGIGGKSFVLITGGIDAIEAAVDAATSEEEIQGAIINSVKIARPVRELIESIC